MVHGSDRRKPGDLAENVCVFAKERRDSWILRLSWHSSNVKVNSRADKQRVGTLTEPSHSLLTTAARDSGARRGARSDGSRGSEQSSSGEIHARRGIRSGWPPLSRRREPRHATR